MSVQERNMNKWRRTCQISGFESDLLRTKSQENYLNKILECINEPSIRRNRLIAKDAFRYYPNCDGRFVHYYNFDHETRGIYSLSYSKCGKYIVIGFGNGSIKILYRGTWKAETFLQGSKIGLPINSIKFNKSNDDNFSFFAGSENGTIALCSVSPYSHRQFITETGNEIYTMELDGNARNLLTAGEDRVIRVYDCATTQLKRKLTGHEKRIYCVRMNPDDENFFASGGIDETLKFWDLRTDKCLLNSAQSCLLFGDGIDIKKGLLSIINWKDPPGQLWDFRQMKKMIDIVPYNREVTKTGNLILCAKFFSSDPDADLLMAGTMGHGSMILFSVKERAIIHSYEVNETIVCLDTKGHEIVFGGKKMGLYVVKFFPHGDFLDIDGGDSRSSIDIDQYIK